MIFNDDYVKSLSKDTKKLIMEVTRTLERNYYIVNDDNMDFIINNNKLFYINKKG